jgi:PhnB protein
MQHVFIYLLFNGACADALHFYERALGAHIEALTTVGESPMAAQFPAGSAHRVIHARLSLGEQTIMASDWMAPQPYPGIHGMRVMLTLADVEKAATIFAALSEQGRVEEPLRQTPFARSYGTLVDRFGVPWQVMVE